MIENRKEFASLLKATVVPSNLPMEEQLQRYQVLQQAAKEILPPKLYRFRSCSEHSFSAFDKDELWVSTADCMNDGFDTRIYLDAKQVNEATANIVDPGKSKEVFFAAIENHPLAKAFQEIIEKARSMSDETYRLFVDETIRFIKEDTAKALLMIPSVGQQTIKFCCFSEDILSSSMWGHYASNESGFAFEYDFHGPMLAESSDPYMTRDCTLFPVIYSKERYQVATEYVVYLLQYRMINTALFNSGIWVSYPEFAQRILASGICPDLSVATKASLHKSDEWEKETEWRLFCTSSNDRDFIASKHGFCIKKPTAIYLGRRISSIHEKILRELARNKAIPVYKMELDDTSPSYVLTIA